MITVFGSINIDLIAHAARMPSPGETVAGSAFAIAAGGKGANQALAARRAGSVVTMTGAVGRDVFATPALALLEEAGVDLSHVRQTEDPTGTALITVSFDGENTIVVIAGANGALTEADARDAIKRCGNNDTLLVQLEIPAKAVETALLEAKKANVRTILTVAPLTTDALRLAKLADIVIANETEFALLSGRDCFSEDALMRLHEETGRSFVVTLGARGAIAISDGILVRAEGLKITPVDTVGAGDTFSGYLAAALDNGADLQEALRRAAVAGSLACLREGAQPSIPDRAAVDGALSGRN